MHNVKFHLFTDEDCPSLKGPHGRTNGTAFSQAVTGVLTSNAPFLGNYFPSRLQYAADQVQRGDRETFPDSYKDSKNKAAASVTGAFLPAHPAAEPPFLLPERSDLVLAQAALGA